MNKLSRLVDQLAAGDQRALSRVVSLIEDGGDTGKELIRLLYPKRRGIQVIGITGPPGAGKSTLTDRIAQELHSAGKKVGILAIDPSSPITGGALLGDRIRMSGASEKSEIFIRSMASRGVSGGLAPRTKETIYALDAAGFDLVLLETVGVGQGEIEIVRTADTVVVVVVPGMGDGVQALKAGILEVADLFALNKADYEGIDRLEKELTTLLGLVPAMGWTPKILRTVATEGKGIETLIGGIYEHQAWAASTGELSARRTRFLEEYLKETVLQLVSERILKDPGFESALAIQLQLIGTGASNPVDAAESLLSSVNVVPKMLKS